MAQPTSPRYICPYCNSDLKYVPSYGQWWCDKCRFYPYDRSTARRAVDEIDDIFSQIEDELGSRSCEYCGITLRYIDQYKQWWCPNCRRYTSLPPPPPPPQPTTTPQKKKKGKKKTEGKN